MPRSKRVIRLSGENMTIKIDPEIDWKQYVKIHTVFFGVAQNKYCASRYFFRTQFLTSEILLIKKFEIKKTKPTTLYSF